MGRGQSEPPPRPAASARALLVSIETPNSLLGVIYGEGAVRTRIGGKGRVSFGIPSWFVLRISSLGGVGVRGVTRRATLTKGTQDAFGKPEGPNLR